jgi:predicted heme/steroid binding protein
MQYILRKYLLPIIAWSIALCLVGAAYLYRHTTQQSQKNFNVSSVLPPAAPASAAKKTYGTAELAAFDGKDGHKCYVAVDGYVYEIEQGRLWKNGEHVTSHGQAICGKDLSNVIGKSPHGRHKLTQLPRVGTFKSKFTSQPR